MITGMFVGKARIWMISTLVAGGIIGGLAAVATSRTAAAVGVNGRIAWKSFASVERAWSIYAANPDGSHRRRLTHPAAGVHDDLPDWSPDGSHVLFERIFQ